MTKSLKAEAKRKFQQLSNGKICPITNLSANASHHIINKNQCESLRYMPINAYPVNSSVHNSGCKRDVEQYNEWTIPDIPNWQRFMLNAFKNTHYKDYLKFTGQTEEEHLREMISEMDRILANR